MLSAPRAEVGSAQAVKHKVWRAGWGSRVDLLWKDFTYTLRRLSRLPSLVFIVVLSIGLGIAANATIFSIVSKFILSPAPVGDPARLVTSIAPTIAASAATISLYPSIVTCVSRRSRSPASPLTTNLPRLHLHLQRARAPLGTGRHRKLLRRSAAPQGRRARLCGQ